MEKLILKQIKLLNKSKDKEKLSFWETKRVNDLEEFIKNDILSGDYNLSDYIVLKIFTKTFRRYLIMFNEIYKRTNLDNIFVLKELLNCEVKLFNKRLEKLGDK